MRISLMEKYYELIFRRKVDRKNKMYGLCHAPWRRAKKIIIKDNMSERRELETLIHEMLHACDFTKSEEWVEQAGKDIATVLWKLGWRKSDEEWVKE